MKESNNEINKCVKVLMVEDNINYGRLIKKNLQSLKNEKFDVILSNSLKEGLQELAIKDIDIVLLDLNLPDSYQIDTFLKIKNNSPNVPVIILTSMDNEEIAIKSKYAKLQKQLSFAELLISDCLKYERDSFRYFSPCCTELPI